MDVFVSVRLDDRARHAQPLVVDARGQVICTFPADYVDRGGDFGNDGEYTIGTFYLSGVPDDVVLQDGIFDLDAIRAALPGAQRGKWDNVLNRLTRVRSDRVPAFPWSLAGRFFRGAS